MINVSSHLHNAPVFMKRRKARTRRISLNKFLSNRLSTPAFRMTSHKLTKYVCLSQSFSNGKCGPSSLRSSASVRVYDRLFAERR